MAEEKNFEKRIRNYISSIGGWSVKYFANSYTPRGIPDLLCCVNGRFIAIEVKAENGRVSKIQEKTIDDIQNSGGYAFTLKPSEFEWFKEWLEEVNNK